MKKLVRRGLLSSALILGLFAGQTPHAGAASLYSWNVWVDSARDGDSIMADIPDDGMGVREVRMIGIQATEYKTCNYDQAKQRMKELAEHKDVTLKAQNPSSSNAGRPLRYVYVGSTDLGSIMLKEGRVLPFPLNIEPLNSVTNLKLAQIARRNRVGPIWNDATCGAGPGHSRIRLVAKWDADRSDDQNVNGEYVRIYNYGSSAISLRGWILRDSSHTQYSFPSSASIRAGDFITVYIGKGTNSSRIFYWGLSRTIFANIHGDGAYLVDPDGDVRASFIYKCYAYCTDVLRGKVNITRYAGSVSIKNISRGNVNMRDYLLSNAPYMYDFGRYRVGSVIRPGETMRVIVGKGTQTRLRRYWPRNKIYGTVQLRSFDWKFVDSD